MLGVRRYLSIPETAISSVYSLYLPWGMLGIPETNVEQLAWDTRDLRQPLTYDKLNIS